MSLGDEAAAASTRYNRRPVVGGAPAKETEDSKQAKENKAEEATSTTQE